MTFLSGFTVLLLFWLGGPRVISGRLGAGDFVAFMSYLEMLAWPMMSIGYTVNLLQRGGASLKRVNAILNEPPEILAPSGGSRGIPPGGYSDSGDGSIAIRRLSFAYSEGGPGVLDDISVEIPRGTTLGILGRTGSGKSTLVKLLPRLLDPPAGTVFIGGRDVRDFDLRALRSAFGVVLQDAFLFSANIRENIAFGRPEIAEEVVERAAALSTISRDLAAFPSGLDTIVGERGVTLSGGQKQRIAISRAIAVSPEFLVLDDALSAVDTETEERILREFLKERRGRTNVVISHRVSTLDVADFIIVLDRGRAIQRGTREELLAEPGLYREIHALQRLEQGAAP